MKRVLSDLAVCGGPPAFRDKLHVGRPNLGNRERFLDRAARIYDGRWLSNEGPFAQEFERRLADHVGVRHCLVMCNATVALEIAVRALGLSGEVIVPSFTFVATAHALQWQGITPVFCDVDPVTHQLNPACIERLVTPRTTGVIGVHLWGEPAGLDALVAIARRRGLALLFDAAHAFGCTFGGRMVGGFGRAEVFSFHATKVLNAGEGGAVATNDHDLAARIRLMRNFGFRGYDDVGHVGTNGKMAELAAALGLTNLESLDEFVAANRRNYDLYRRGLAGLAGFRVFVYDERERRNFQYVVLEVDAAAVGVSRDQLVSTLHAENILARRYFYPGCHRMEPYRSYFPNAGLLLPQTERLADRVLALPTGTQVTERDIEVICDLIRFVARNTDGVARAVAGRTPWSRLAA